MNSTIEPWEKPDFEIITFTDDDIIRTSGGVLREESGFGDKVTWDDLFG